MFLTALFIAFKFVLCIVSAAGAIGLLIGVIIGVGALIAAIFHVFPVVGIVIGVLVTAIVVYVAAHCINLTVKEKSFIKQQKKTVKSV